MRSPADGRKKLSWRTPDVWSMTALAEEAPAAEEAVSSATRLGSGGLATAAGATHLQGTDDVPTLDDHRCLVVGHGIAADGCIHEGRI
jgi:hypothetical protein